MLVFPGWAALTLSGIRVVIRRPVDRKEVHVYYGHSENASKGSLNKRNSILTAPNSALSGSASGAAQLILGWARYTIGKDESRPATNEWVGNGYNWTGKFYGVSVWSRQVMA